MTSFRFSLWLAGVFMVSVLLTVNHIAFAEQEAVSNNNNVETSTAGSSVSESTAPPLQEVKNPMDTGDENNCASRGENCSQNPPDGAPRTSSWDKFLSWLGFTDNSFAPPPQELSGSPDLFGQDYIIGPGDQLGIAVWRDDVLTRTVLVLPDGKIQMPLVGELMAGGKTVGEVKKELMEKLASYVVDADISVEVKQSSSLFIYIIGRVNAPGRQMLVANTTVMQALAMAGGLNPFAQEDGVKIFRHEKDKTLVYKFRYSYVSAGKHLEDNILLKRGDVVVVP